jgi:hypothetical protein
MVKSKYYRTNQICVSFENIFNSEITLILAYNFLVHFSLR